MKILLCAVNAKYIHSNLAIYSLRSYAVHHLEYAGISETDEIQIELAEYTINQNPEEILADLYQKKPDVLAFSCYIWNWKIIQELLHETGKILPDTEIWLGGPEVTFHADTILAKYPQLSGIMIGEGEKTFCSLLKYYQGSESLRNIPGIITAEYNGGVPEIVDMDTIPFYYEELTETELQKFEHKIIYYESGRGCPFRCSYCLSSLEKKVRIRNAALVKRELQFFLDRNVSQVKFIDRTFNCDHEHAKQIWKFLIEHDNGITNFHFEISADLLDEEELRLLSKMRPGLIQLEIGVQTANPETLKAIRRTASMEKLKKNVEQIFRFRNIHQHLDLIAGLPYEDYQSFGRSFNEVYAMHPDQLQLGFLKVLKGSEMEQAAAGYDMKFLSMPPYEILSTKWLSYAEVLKLKRIEEMVELYYNSGQFAHMLPVLETLFDSPFALFSQLAEYYEKKEYHINQPARIYRYDILLHFAEEKEPAYADLWAELLTFDLYLRENMKSRPVFAPEIQHYRAEIREYFRLQEQAEEHPGKHPVRQSDAKSDVQGARKHLEPFSFPVWEAFTAEEMKCSRQKENKVHFLVFDYQNRNPLNQEARYREAFTAPLQK